MHRSPAPIRSGPPRLGLTALLAAVALIAVACGGGSDGATTGSSGGSIAEIDFVADTLDGGQLDSGDLEGRDVVLWFWAPW